MPQRAPRTGAAACLDGAPAAVHRSSGEHAGEAADVRARWYNPFSGKGCSGLLPGLQEIGRNMTNEYMPEYRPIDKHGIAVKMSGAKWGLIIMAAACFVWAAFMYLTPATGGAGLLMVTPENGARGLVQLLPWVGVIAGFLATVLTLGTRPSWALGWAEPIMDILMLLAGLWGIYSTSQLGSFNGVYTVVGFFLALYIAIIAIELYRRGERMWVAELAVAAAVWLITFLGGLNMAADHAQVVFSCIAFFIAAWGFVYGAIKLAGIPTEE